MKYLIATLVVAVTFAGNVQAAEKKTLELSPNQANIIANGLMLLGGHDVLVKDARGQDTTAHIPFKMDPQLTLTLGHDLSVLRAFLIEANNAAKGSPDQKDAINSTLLPIELLTFDSKDLKLGPDNPYTPETLSYIEPLFADYIAPTPSLPASKDKVSK